MFNHKPSFASVGVSNSLSSAACFFFLSFSLLEERLLRLFLLCEFFCFFLDCFVYLGGLRLFLYLEELLSVFANFLLHNIIFFVVVVVD